MVMGPARISFGESHNIYVEALYALEIIVIVFFCGSVCETFDVLKQKADGASLLLIDWITIRYCGRWIDTVLTETPAGARRRNG
jgi:hypothetical protein